jgi:predicted DNA-binding WGR domain protein
VTLLQRINPDRNERRYYRVEIGPCVGYPIAVHRVWGRLGRRRSGFLITPCADEAEALRLAETLITRKLKRGYKIVRKGEQMMTTELTENLNQLANLANQAGAEGIWLLRGAAYVSLSYVDKGVAEELDAALESPAFEELLKKKLISLDLADANLIVVMRFPEGDGGEPGIESK